MTFDQRCELVVAGNLDPNRQVARGHSLHRTGDRPHRLCEVVREHIREQDRDDDRGCQREQHQAAQGRINAARSNEVGRQEHESETGEWHHGHREEAARQSSSE